tara:strand:+ start:1027 stop:1806 length:780 start_codon:yes stop_codon:yes gene_type:complete
MRNLILLILFNIIQISFSQDIIIKDEVTLLESDQFENIFIVNETNKLLKYPKDNYTNYLEFSNIEYGNIQKIMINNPFRLIIFYEDSQKILFLDKNLNELNIKIDLFNLFNNRIIDVANSSNLLFFISELNEIFVYDISKGKVINSKKILLSTNSKSIKIFSNENMIFVLENNSKKVLNHQLDFLFEKKNKWTQKTNKILFDNNKIYEYCYTDNELFLINTDNNFKRIIVKNINNSIFTIKNEKIFLIRNKLLTQQLLK